LISTPVESSARPVNKVNRIACPHLPEEALNTAHMAVKVATEPKMIGPVINSMFVLPIRYCPFDPNWYRCGFVCRPSRPSTLLHHHQTSRYPANQFHHRAT